jgi:uncharacterized protein (DUF1501 family)
LRAAGLLSGGVALANLFPSVAQAAPATKRRFVFAYFEGGWDLLLGLDPRDPRTTTAAAQLIDPGYGQLGAIGQRGLQRAGALTFGPAVHASFLPFANRCSIINGITMDTASHEAGRRYFITGRFPRGITAVGSSTTAEILAQIGESSTIPHMSINVESYATGLPSHASALDVGSLTDLLVALRPLSMLDPAIETAVKQFQDARSCASTQANGDGLVSRLEKSVSTSRSYLAAQLDRLFDLTRMDPEMAALRTRYDLNAITDAAAPEVLAFIAGQAIKNGVSQCVSFRAATTLDTHGQDWASDHASRQERGWKVLAALLGDLAATPSKDVPSRSMLDETTVIAFSEFGRTPLFNSIRGRDHFLGNSVLVAGAGVKHGLTIGKSAAVGMMPVETDLMSGAGVDTPTQQQRDSGQVAILTPKHVLATVLESAGLDATYLRTPSIKALIAT